MKKALLVTNLAAGTVSVRLKQVIAKALSADLKLEVADTERRHHATELAQDAVDREFDLVVAFGGDGTMNEVANALVGTQTALAVLPGGMANVLCRSLGVPSDIVDATGSMLNRIQAWDIHNINVGRMDGRHFVMSCGIGLDAATVRKVEGNQRAKRRWKDWFFLYSALRVAFGEYRGMKPHLQLDLGDEQEEVALAIISNIPTLTYFKRWPITITPQAKLEKGLDVLAARRFPLRYIPPLFWSTFGSGSHVGWKHMLYRHDVGKLRISGADAFPVQVDGEFAGEFRELTVESVPNALPYLL